MIKFTLDKVMKERNLTIQEVMNATGVTRPTISQLSNGKAKGIQFDTLTKLVSGLGISIDELFEDVLPDSDIRYVIDFPKIASTTVGDPEEPSIFVTFVQNIQDDALIASFRMPLTVSFDSTTSPSDKKKNDTIIFSCLSSSLDVEELPERNLLNLKDFFSSTPVGELERLLGYVSNDCIKELKLSSTYKLVVFRSDIDNIMAETWSTVFSWDSTMLSDSERFNQFLNIKYQY